MASMSATSRMAASRFICRSKRTMRRPAPTMDGFIPAARSGSGPWAATQKREPARSIVFAAANCVGSMPALPSRTRSAFRPMAPRPISPIAARAILYRVAIDPANALPTGDPETLYDTSGGVGGLDGAVVDAEGLIWNARWGGSCIDVYTPGGRSGSHHQGSGEAAELPGLCRPEFRPRCWSPRPGRAWTSMPGLPIRTTAKPSFSTSAHGGGRNLASGSVRHDGPLHNRRMSAACTCGTTTL